jgi:hypothetical protein
MFRLLPTFLRLSGYSQLLCRSLVQVPHFGFARSHFSFLPRHDTHEIVFSAAAAGLSFPVEAVGFCGPASSMEEEAGVGSNQGVSGLPGPDHNPGPDINSIEIAQLLCRRRGNASEKRYQLKIGRISNLA